MAITIDLLLARAEEARRQHRLTDAMHDFAAAAQMCRKTSNLHALALALTRLGQTAKDAKEPDAARRNYEEAVSIYRQLADRMRIAHTVRHLGDLLRTQGEASLAEGCYLEALEIYRGDRNTTSLDLANTIRGFALLKSDIGPPQEAIALWTEAKRLYESLDVQPGVIESELYIGRLLHLRPGTP